jgi:hypothetical protein
VEARVERIGRQVQRLAKNASFTFGLLSVLIWLCRVVAPRIGM